MARATNLRQANDMTFAKFFTNEGLSKIIRITAHLIS